MDAGDGLSSGEEIHQLGRSEQAARSTLSPPGEGLFAKDPGCLQPYERCVRTLGSDYVTAGDSLAIHDRMIRQILDNTNRHRLAACVDTGFELFKQSCDPFRDIGHPANGPDDSQREGLQPAIDISLLVGTQTLDVPVGVLGPND
jgi:hypothetical protein